MSTGALLLILALLGVLALGALLVWLTGRVLLPRVEALTDESAAFAFEVATERQPTEAIAALLVGLTPELDRLGYAVESNAGATASVVRTYVPRAVYVVPWSLAVIAFILGVLSSAHNAAANGGRVAVVLLVIGVLLRLMVKRRHRITFSARPTDTGSSITVTGSTYPGTEDDLKSMVIAQVETGRAPPQGQTTPA